jgi:hypothetical protein
MQNSAALAPAYVIKAEELSALNYLDPGHPQPLLIEWIDRGTDKPLRPTTVEQLLRTQTNIEASPSITRLRDAAGLRAVFETSAERDRFAGAFTAARAKLAVRKQYMLAAIFGNIANAEAVVAELKRAGIPEDSISLLWQAQHNPAAINGPEAGHTRFSIAAATAGAGVAGALLGVGFLALIPGIGAIAAAGAAAAVTIQSVATISGIFGATGGAMAKMLTDLDVDDRDVGYFETQIRRGRVFLAVDTRIAKSHSARAREILLTHGGRKPEHSG